MPTPQEILNLPPDASPDQIRQAYAHWARLVHPDLVSDDLKPFATGLMQRINAAYQELSEIPPAPPKDTAPAAARQESQTEQTTVPPERHYDARLVASAFIALGVKNGQPLNAQQVNKLVYLANAWHQGYRIFPMLRQDIGDTRYGPIIWDIYYALKPWKQEPVTYQIKGFEVDPDKNPFNPGQYTFIRQVYEKYGNYSGPQLSAFCTQKGTPWYHSKSRAKRLRLRIEAQDQPKLWQKLLKPFLPRTKPGVMHSMDIATSYHKQLVKLGMVPF